MKLLLIRHGQTEWNKALRTQGRTDIPLSEAGVLQAETLAGRLASVPVRALYSSPLQRAAQTARILSRAHGIRVQEDAALIERDFGDWEGLPFATLEQQYPKEMALWRTDPLSCTPPNAEPLCDVYARCEAFLAMLRAQYEKEDTVLIVSHSVPLRIMLMLLIGLPAGSLHNIQINNAAYTELVVSQRRGILTALNA